MESQGSVRPSTVTWQGRYIHRYVWSCTVLLPWPSQQTLGSMRLDQQWISWIHERGSHDRGSLCGRWSRLSCRGKRSWCIAGLVKWRVVSADVSSHILASNHNPTVFAELAEIRHPDFRLWFRTTPNYSYDNQSDITVTQTEVFMLLNIHILCFAIWRIIGVIVYYSKISRLKLRSQLFRSKIEGKEDGLDCDWLSRPLP